jgi:hypothetical protein
MVGSVDCSIPVGSIVSNPQCLLTNSIYEWDAQNSMYRIASSVDAGGPGYWMFALCLTDIEMNCDAVPSPPVAQESGPDAAAWESVLTLQVQNQRQELTLGMHPSASAGFDASLDKPIPPFPGMSPSKGKAKNSIVKAGWMVEGASTLLSESYMGVSDVATWQLSVDIFKTGKLKWSDLPAGYSFTLVCDGEASTMRPRGTMNLSSGEHEVILIVEAVGTSPGKSQVLSSYPNPFNPETWIPYRLSEASDVLLIIRDMSGREVRRFHLHSQPAGEYVDKSRALYWDGRNESGELVGSGVYFYTLQTGQVKHTGKLVIMR